MPVFTFLSQNNNFDTLFSPVLFANFSDLNFSLLYMCCPLQPDPRWLCNWVPTAGGKDYWYDLLFLPFHVPQRPCFPFSLPGAGLLHHRLPPWAREKAVKFLKNKHIAAVFFISGVKQMMWGFLTGAEAFSLHNWLCFSFLTVWGVKVDIYSNREIYSVLYSVSPCKTRI